jgi:hypothetical protein
LSCFYVEGDVIDGGQRTVTLRQMADLDHGVPDIGPGRWAKRVL